MVRKASLEAGRLSLLGDEQVEGPMMLHRESTI
jgi:hypothetical protein